MLDVMMLNMIKGDPEPARMSPNSSLSSNVLYP